MLNHPLAKRQRQQIGKTLRQVGLEVSKTLQEEHGWTVSIGEDVISRWERGEREPRNSETLRAYAHALELEPGRLVAKPEAEAVNG